jgi:hypothetical protein
MEGEREKGCFYLIFTFLFPEFFTPFSSFPTFIYLSITKCYDPTLLFGEGGQFMTAIKSFFASRWGIARNPCLKYLLGDALGCEVKAPEDPQMVGAYGAAIIAQDSDK